MNGKGSKQRPTNHEAYASSYEAIFGKKARTKLEDTVEGFGGRTYDTIIFDDLPVQPYHAIPLRNPCLDIDFGTGKVSDPI